MMKKLIFSLAFCLVTISAQASVIENYIEAPVKVGSDRLTYLIWDVYDAALFSAAETFDPQQPFALQLDYLRSLTGESIADRSLKEMRGLGFDNEAQLSQWLEQMRSLFPDVSAGDRLTGVRSQEGSALFYYNDEFIGAVDDPVFTRAFFDIWLSPKTSQPELRSALLGER